MMSTIPWLELSLALGPALVALVVYEILWMGPLRRRVSELAVCCRSLEQATEGATGLAVRLLGAERRLKEQLEQLGGRVGQLELRSDSRPYEQAISLAEQGERAERLVSYFGLTEGEASLVSLLHGAHNRCPGTIRRPR